MHWPAFDGLRAIAVIAVIFYHVGVLPGGYLGVDLFFVLSGFLITSLLIQEWDRRGGRISFRDFYMRRVLRLFPALGCVILVSVALALYMWLSGPPGSRPYTVGTLEGVPWVVAFAGNWVRALSPPSSPLGTLGLLGHTWSLAVEEQFYLLWPALFALLMRRRFSRGRVALMLALAAATEMAYQAAMGYAEYGSDRVYYGTDTHSEGLLIGCAIAFWLSAYRDGRAPSLAGARSRRATGVAAAVILLLFVIPSWTTVAIPSAVLACGVVLMGVVTGRIPAFLERVLSYEPSVLIGRRSYGLYLWHYLILEAAVALYPAEFAGDQRGLASGMAIGAMFIAFFAVTELSYRYVELPALRLKRRFREVSLEPVGARATMASLPGRRPSPLPMPGSPLTVSLPRRRHPARGATVAAAPARSRHAPTPRIRARLTTGTLRSRENPIGPCDPDSIRRRAVRDIRNVLFSRAWPRFPRSSPSPLAAG